jgi:BNR/Asp-box repeat
MPPVILGPRCNRQVTCSPDPHNDRSESALAVNPTNVYNMVGSSKKFTDPLAYLFSLAAYYTFDGGQSWKESPPLALLNTGDLDGAGVVWTGLPWAGVSDPAVAWDDVGNAFIIGLMWASTPTPMDPFHFDLLGMAAYKSTDGGRTWSVPKVIHVGIDDKQWAAGDLNPASPYHGNVYAVWDDLTAGQLAFARTTDHGATWIGPGAQPAGASITNEMFFAEVNVANDGTVYIFGLGNDAGQSAIKFMKSIDGGQTFSGPNIVASPITPVPGKLPGGKFRLESLPTGCCGSGNRIVCAWPDFREGVARIYYNRSNNGGNSWQGSASGDPLLTGAVASAADQHDFMPQIVSTPDGEIGCAFYEFGPKGGGSPLIDVVLAVSTDNGHTFPERATITEQPWDPTVDEVWAHGDPTTTFIGDYFGLDASRLGFFPFWTDTRTMVQEIFTARVSVNPADVYIRDSSSDTGDVPSPGNHWEAPDLIVRWQPDGDVNFSDQGLQQPVLNDHYVYGRVTNRGPNTARNVTLAVTVGNWPQLASLPGTEFRYPQDWYQGDWDSAALMANRLFLGESAPIATLANGNTQIIGPVLWPAGQIPAQGTWHPCLLAEVRADNNDSAGGPNGCDIDADPDPCAYGSYFWGNNNACQRNLTYVPVPAAREFFVEFPFLVGSVWSKARFLEVIIDKGRELAMTPMMLRVDKVYPAGGTSDLRGCPAELVLIEGGRVAIRVNDREAGEIIAAPRTVWRPDFPSAIRPAQETCHGALKVGQEWKLIKPTSAVGFPITAGELRRMTLSFVVPANLKPKTRAQVRMFQRNDRRVTTGSVTLELQVREAKEGRKVPPVPKKAPTRGKGKRREA